MPEISIHPASDDEKLAAFRNVHEFWGGGLSQQEFVSRRLASAKHQRARWWVLTVDDEVVSSLGCFELEFFVEDRVLPGFGICSVHTRPEHRGQGYAAKLCDEVGRARRAAGDELGLLYSDVPAAYYEKLGYRVVSEATFFCDRLADLAAAGEHASLQPIEHPEAELTSLDEWYRRAHADDTLWLYRNEDYWRYSLQKVPDSRFFVVGEPAVGYVRTERADEALEILEVAVPLDQEHAVYRAVANQARMQGCEAIHGWLRANRPLPREFTSRVRPSQIPMICPLSDRASVHQTFTSQNCHFWRSDHF